MSGIRYEDGVSVGEGPAVIGLDLACDRCGTFAPLCWSWGKRLCAECRARAHPVLTTPSTVRTLVVESCKVLPALGLRGVVLTLALLPLTLALRVVRPAPDTDSVRLDTLHDLGPTALLSLPHGVVAAITTHVLLQVLVGDGRADYGRAWRAVYERRIAVLTLAVVQSLLEDAAFVALQFLGLMLVSLPLTLAYPILMHEDVSAWSAMRRSAFRMRGNQLRMLGVTIVYSIALVAPVIPAFIAMSSNPTFERLSTPVIEGLAGLMALPLVAASVVLYGKLPPRMSERSVLPANA
jgi:hypothetical protein